MMLNIKDRLFCGSMQNQLQEKGSFCCSFLRRFHQIKFTLQEWNALMAGLGEFPAIYSFLFGFCSDLEKSK
jgi:hypothetical protein